jgi:steroid 5-alpha reductase family enzyme
MWGAGNPLPLFTRAALGWMGAAILMTAVWLGQRRTRNAGLVDVAWTVAVAGLAVLYAVFGGGWTARRLAIGAMTAIWGLRLASHLFVRVHGQPEDGRYADLRQRWGDRANARLFWFFQLQAVAAAFFALPALLASADPHPALRPVETAAIGLWVLAFVGEASADRQLARCKAEPSMRGRTCRAGWWRYSRHPNYFFEWTMWVAYSTFAVAAPFGALAFCCPAAMLFLLLRVTGIPATEAQAIRSRGDEYRRYQQTTSMFVPLPPRG